MNDIPSLRSLWKRGFFLVLWSCMTVYLAFKIIDDLFGWILREPSGMKMSPVAATALEAVVLVVFGPVIIATLIYASDHGWNRTFAQVGSFWIHGLKLGIIYLVLILPGIIIQQGLEHLALFGVVDSDPRAGVLRDLIIWLSYLLIAPVWAWPLFQSLRRTALGGRRVRVLRPRGRRTC